MDFLERTNAAAADLALTCNTPVANLLAQALAATCDKVDCSGGEASFACARLMALCVSSLTDREQLAVALSAMGLVATAMATERLDVISPLKEGKPN